MVLRLLLERSTAVETVDVGPWLPSLLVRRLERLELAVGDR
jgi:cytochrome P450 family 144